ncbi:MAG: hypothetical protein OXS33_11195 [bacterium]|nr:hypothetical protein [bacterium]
MALGEFDELPHQAAAVGWQSIPDDQQRFLDVTHERFEKKAAVALLWDRPSPPHKGVFIRS